MLSLPPGGCWFFNPQPYRSPSSSGFLPSFALRARWLHDSNHSLISRPGVRSLRHSWSLRSLTDGLSSIPTIHSSIHHYALQAELQENRNTNKGPSESEDLTPFYPGSYRDGSVSHRSATSVPRARLRNQYSVTPQRAHVPDALRKHSVISPARFLLERRNIRISGTLAINCLDLVPTPRAIYPGSTPPICSSPR